MDHIIWNQQQPVYSRQNHFDSDRMAGSVPVWTESTAETKDSFSSIVSSLAEGDAPAVQPPSLSLGEALDIVNPLHHLPVVGNLYRNLTGDQISGVARIAGGTLYGGVTGGVVSLANAAIEEHSGHSMMDAITSAASQDNAKYASAFDDAPRSAGLKRDARPSAEQPVMNSQDNLFAALEDEARQPVTHIDIAFADSSHHRRSLNG